MPTTATLTFTNKQLLPFYPQDARRQAVRLPASVAYAAGTVLGELYGNNEVQQVAITGSPTSGTFTLTYAGQTTAAIAFNATAAQVATALQALTNVGALGVATAGGPLPGTPVTVTFQNPLGSTNVAQMTSTDSLGGGSSPASAVTTTTQGSAGTPGTFKAYTAGAADGSQVPRGLLEYDCATDASGNITFGTAAGGSEWGTRQSAPAFFSGTFATGDLVGLDAAGVTAAGWRLSSGTVANGVVVLP